MTRENLEKYLSNEYGTDGEFLWAKYPGYEVFRHSGNKKWFAILMDVPQDKLGIKLSNGANLKTLNILDVKCDSILIGSLLNENGFYPAYHMNKSNWISMDIACVDDEKIKWLLDMSYDLTTKKIR